MSEEDVPINHDDHEGKIIAGMILHICGCQYAYVDSHWEKVILCSLHLEREGQDNGM